MSRISAILATCIGILSLCGCSHATKGLPPPQTFAVTGEVKLADGKPVAKGLVQFLPENGPSRNISAPIKDGKFTLGTAFGNQLLPGTTEGHYRVKIIPGFDSHGAPIEITLPNVYEIKPQDNQFVFTLPKGLRAP
jgi:hypothetical protein